MTTLAVSRGAGENSPLHDREFKLFRDLMYRHAGISLSDAKKQLVAGRLAKRLLARGARVDARNDWGDGALEWAMRNNRMDIARAVSDPESFQAAVNQPKEKWGQPQRSLNMSPELEALLAMRKTLSERQHSTDAIDRRIAAERVRIVREQMDRPTLQRATTLEITAQRQQPSQQSARIVGQEAGKLKGGAPVPPATFHGRAKMPVKAPVRNY